jgi:hypothetical protein
MIRRSRADKSGTLLLCLHNPKGSRSLRNSRGLTIGGDVRVRWVGVVLVKLGKISWPSPAFFSANAIWQNSTRVKLHHSVNIVSKLRL